MTRQAIAAFIGKKYGARPEFLWRDFPEYEVFRHSDNGKWFALLMNIKPSKLGLDGTDQIDILDVKCDPGSIQPLLMKDGFYKAYHMNKKHWISVSIKDVGDDEIENLIETSFCLTETKK